MLVPDHCGLFHRVKGHFKFVKDLLALVLVPVGKGSGENNVAKLARGQGVQPCPATAQKLAI